jgi:predicted secreted protein
MNFKKIAIIMLLACFATSVSFAQKSKTAVKALTIKEADNAKTIAVKKGQTFNVLFEKECRGCRGIWTLTKSDIAIVKSVKDSFSNPSCTNCAGGNQDHTFVFKALKAGKTSLEFNYMEKSFGVKIIVK